MLSSVPPNRRLKPPGAPAVGDSVVAADDLRDGDIVYFERVAPNHIIIRLVTHEFLVAYTGPIFAVVVGDASGKADFREVSRDDVE